MQAMATAIATDGAAAHAAMTTAELHACARLPGRQRRQDFRAGRLAAKRAAGVVLGGLPARRIEVASHEDGAPRVTLLDARGRGRPANVDISISHCGGRAVAIATTALVRVGIDLERTGSVPAWCARYFLADAEARFALVDDVTAIWSLKEAAWKALGLPRSLPFKALELCGGPDGDVIGARVQGRFVPVRARIDSPWPNYLMAVVWTSEVCT